MKVMQKLSAISFQFRFLTIFLSIIVILTTACSEDKTSSEKQQW